MSSSSSSFNDVGNFQVGWIGLGNMGKLMAINLANALNNQGAPKLKVFNRTLSKSEEVANESKGVEIVNEIEEIGKTCQIIFSSLSNDDVVKEVYQKLFDSIKKKKKNSSNNSNDDVLFIETSTVYPDVTTSLLNQANQIGAKFVAALPFGQPPVAKTAQLAFAIAGEKEAVKKAKGLIVPHIGRMVLEFGTDPAKASTFKLIGNSIILSTVEMMTESMTLAEKTGIGADRVLEWVEAFYPAPSAINYATKIANLKFVASGGFDLQGGLKDANHIARLGKESDCQMHIVEQAIKHLNTTIDLNKDQENKDWAALCAAQRVQSGLKPFEN